MTPQGPTTTTAAAAQETAPHINASRCGWRIAYRVTRLVVLLAIVLLVLHFAGCMERMFYVPTRGPTPVPPQFAGAEAVQFNSADGTQLYGWFLPAQPNSADLRDDAGRAPTILHVHGNAGNLLDHIGFTEYLPRAGFNLFIFDYRGYGQSQGVARSREPLIADTHAALDALLERADVDPQRIAMYGQSLGGAIGLNVMAHRPQIRAAVIESAFASWRDIAANVASQRDPPGLIGRALAALLIADTHRPDEAIAHINRPLLLIHGDGDNIVPVSHSRRLAAAAGKWAKLVELTDGEHNTLRNTHPHVDRLVIQFFREHLSDDVAAKQTL